MITNTKPPLPELHTFDSIMRLLFEDSPYKHFDHSTISCDLQGWGSNHPIFSFMVDFLRPELVIEVGSWKGGSTVTLANALKKHGLQSPVIAVDTWLGALEHLRSDQFKRRNGYPELYFQFLANMVYSDVHNHVIPFPQTSHIAAEAFREYNIKADLIYIDASHEYKDVFEDLIRYLPLLSDNGILIGDDYHTSWPGVIKAAKEVASANALDLYIWESKYVFLQEKRHIPCEQLQLISQAQDIYFDYTTGRYAPLAS